MIRVEIDFTDSGRFENLIRYIEDNLIYGEAQEQIRILGHHTADNMRKYIQESRKRHDRGTHKLENAIEATTLSTTAGVEMGIGEIARLKIEAPYFEMINDGGTYITKNTFTPPPFEDGEFRTFKAESSHTITGINYVGRAIKDLDKELKEMVEKLGGTWLSQIETI